jgi:hypothetical protein
VTHLPKKVEFQVSEKSDDDSENEFETISETETEFMF